MGAEVMTRPTIKIHNTETGEIVEREFNDEEMAAYEADNLKATEQAKVQTQAEADKAALLAKLGITADEAKLLLS